MTSLSPASHRGRAPDPPRAVLVVGADARMTDMVLQELSAESPPRAPIVLVRRTDAEHYLSASADAGRPPAAAILSIQDPVHGEQVELLQWIRGQNEPLCRIPVILVGDDVPPGLGNDLFSLFLRHADPGAMTHALARALGHEGWDGKTAAAL